MTPRESRKWRALASKIIDVLTDYDAPVQALIEEAQAIAQDESLTMPARNVEIARINRAISELDASTGQDEVVLVLESEECQFIESVWWTLKFPGDRTTRERIEAVSTMLDGAVDVKIADGRVVPIEKTNGRAKNVRTLARR